MATFRPQAAVKLTRKEKVEQTRQRLHQSTAEIIGESGFASATLIRITDRAGIALGTFYNYFQNREELFADLVVEYGVLLRAYVSSHIPRNATFFEREEAAFRAWFRFLYQNPFFVRVLSEAELFVPEAFEEYFKSIDDGYRRVLRNASQRGEIRTLDDDGIEAMGLTLMSSRIYYGLRLKHRLDEDGNMDEKIVAAYMTFVRGGLAPNPSAHS